MMGRALIREDDLPETWREDYRTTRNAGDQRVRVTEVIEPALDPR